MRASVLVRTLLLLVFSLTAWHATQAQYVIGYSRVTFDDATNSVFGYSVSELDYFGSFNYQAYVEGYLYDQAGNVLDSGSDSSYFLALVVTNAAALPASLYTVYSDHYLIAYYYTEVIIKEPEGCMPCDGCNTDCYYFYDNWYWWDVYGFSFMNTGYFGDWWQFWAYEVPRNLEEEYIYQGTTGDFLVTPPDWCRLFSDSDPPPEYSASYYSSEATSCAARPYITGQQELWYFDGVTNVPNYATRITLTAHPGGQGSYWWDVIAGGDKAQFVGNQILVNTGDDHIDLISVGASSQANDVSIVVSVNGVTSARFKVTVSAPNSLQQYAVPANQDWDPPGYTGYKTVMSYQIIRKLGGIMPAAVGVNERFPNAKHNVLSNDWVPGCPNGDNSNSAGQFTDVVGHAGGNPAACHPDCCTTELVYTLDQEWRVGSIQTGLANTGDTYGGCPSGFTGCNCQAGPSLGRLVQRDILEKFTDRGGHGNIVSPVP
jgi:hypothetical protein